MNTTTTIPPTTTSLPAVRSSRTSPVRRFFGVITKPRSYKSIGYLLLGLPLGTAWFSVLISGLSVGISMLTVALLGIPILLALWYAVRLFANVERTAANVLLDQHLGLAPIASSERGNLWVRLRSMTGDRDRRREFAYLMLRFPVGIATFTAATTALATPFLVGYAPFVARYGGDQPFGDWAMSSRMEHIANSPWSWFLIPLGLGLLFVSFHAMNALAKVCGRWTATSLGPDRAS